MLGKDVAVRNVESVICTVLQNFAKSDIGRLPKKSLSAQMMVECEVLAKNQVEKLSLKVKRIPYTWIVHRKSSMSMPLYS